MLSFGVIYYIQAAEMFHMHQKATDNFEFNLVPLCSNTFHVPITVFSMMLLDEGKFPLMCFTLMTHLHQKLFKTNL
jgi:hypothetical protein